MSLKTKLVMGCSLVVAGFMSSCEDEPKQKTPQTVKAEAQKKTFEENQKSHLGQTPDLLQRLEVYSKFEQSTDQYSLPAKDDGQFVTMVVDSGGFKRTLFLDNASGYAYLMDHMDHKKIKGYHLKGIQLIRNDCIEEGMSDMRSFEVHMVHDSSKGKEDVKHKNNKQTVLQELKDYEQYGSLFGTGSNRIEYKDEKVPVYAEINTPMGLVRVKPSAANGVIEHYKTNFKLKVTDAELSSFEYEGSGSSTYAGYKLTMDK